MTTRSIICTLASATATTAVITDILAAAIAQAPSRTSAILTAAATGEELAGVLVTAAATATTTVTTVATKAAKALAAALLEAGEDVDTSEIVSWVVDPVADEDARVIACLDDLIDAVDSAIATLDASEDPDGVRAAIGRLRRLEMAVGRLHLRFGQVMSQIRTDTKWSLEHVMSPTPKDVILARARAASEAAEEAVSRIDSPAAAAEAAIACELASSAWAVIGDLERTRIWRERSRGDWFATDFE